jgi:hypothetical protein
MSEPIQTSEIALAVFLIVNGHQPHQLRLRKSRSEDGYITKICIWEFDHHNSIKKLMSDYQSGQARVEPREFARTWGSVRREMNDFLGF